MKNILFVMLFAMLLLVPSVSAFEFDNTKSYDLTNREITFKNTLLGIPISNIAKAKLLTPQINYVQAGKDVLVAEFDVDLYDTEYKEVLKNMKFFDLKRGGKEIARDFSYKYKIITPQTVDDIQRICKNTGSSYPNGTAIVSCLNKKVGTKIIDVVTWKKFNTTDLKKGITHIGLFADVNYKDRVEWGMEMFGVSVLDVWAIWTSNLSGGLVAYYKLDETSGTSAIDSVTGKYNMTAYNTPTLAITGIQGTAYNFSSASSQKANFTKGITEFTADGEANIVSVSLWIKTTASYGAEHTALQIAGNGGDDYIRLMSNYGVEGKLNFMTPENPSAVAEATASNDGAWHHFVGIYNSSGRRMYKDGVFESSVNNADTTIFNSLVIGAYGAWGESSTYWEGAIDEVGLWNRTLTVAEITELYNIPFPPSVSLTSPANATKTTNPSQTFVCNVTAIATTINNATLYIWNATGTGIVYQNTTGISGTQNLTNWTFSLPVDNNYLWNCQACDSDGDCGFASENRTLSIDTAPPTINVLYPSATIPIAYLGENISLNYSIIDTDIASCWVEYNGTNSSIPCSANTTMILDTQKTLKIWANDSVGNINYTRADWDYGSFINSETHDNDVYETEESTFILNDTYDTSNYVSISAALVYNGVSYDASKSGTGQNILFTKAINAPLVTADTNKTFYWNITLVNNSNSVSYHVSQNYTQLVRNANDIYIGSCGSNITAFKFDFSDEVSIIPVPLVNVSYSINYGLSTGNIGTIYGNLPNINNFTICIPNSSTYYLGGEINYLAGGYSNRRYYIFDNTKSIEPTTNITAYLLDSTSSKDFNINVYDNYQNPYAFYYVSLIKWFPSLNEYKIVEMSKTNEMGKTLVLTKLSDTDYRIGVYSLNGSLIKMTNPLKMICLISPCEYNIYVSEADKDYTSEYGIESSLTFNSSLNRFLFIWNDPSQKTQSMTLKITKQGISTDLILCEESSSGYTGAIVCDVGNQTGTLKAAAYRTASPLKMINSIIVTLGNGLNVIAGGTWGLLLGVISVMLVALIGVFSPIASIVLAVVVLIPLVLLGAINWMILVGIAVIGGAIIHILRRT